MKTDSIKSYPFIKSRGVVWKEIVRYVLKDTGKIKTLLELGPGFCDFINQFPAETKIAYEQNPDMVHYAKSEIDLRINDVSSISEIDYGTIDMVFASNFLEHLDKDALNRLLPEIYRILKPKGLFVAIQPNYRLCSKTYFDDETHITIFSDDSITTFLTGFGFSVIKIIPGFLPFSMKSRFPKWPCLVRLYLNLPFKPMAAQMYVVAERR